MLMADNIQLQFETPVSKYYLYFLINNSTSKSFPFLFKLKYKLPIYRIKLIGLLYQEV